MMINSSVGKNISADSIYLVEEIPEAEKSRQLNDALADAGLAKIMQNLDWQESAK